MSYNIYELISLIGNHLYGSWAWYLVSTIAIAYVLIGLFIFRVVLIDIKVKGQKIKRSKIQLFFIIVALWIFISMWILWIDFWGKYSPMMKKYLHKKIIAETSH